MLTPRSELVLRLIVEDYIRSAEPVGSRFLVEEHQIGVSSATIRNEMVQLETEGYIRQPHTSAGRIPTEKGYQYYLRHIVAGEAVKHPQAGFTQKVVREKEIEETLKSIALSLVQFSGETAFVAFDPRFSYYAGVSNLFHKPDFHDLEMIRSLSVLIDSFDEIVAGMTNRSLDQPTVYIGTEGPFGEHVSAIVLRYTFPNNQKGMLGIIGPLRMDYLQNLALMKQASTLLDNMYET